MKIRYLILALVATFFSAGFGIAQEAVFKPGQKVDLKLAGVPPDDQALVSGVYTISGNGSLNLPYIGELNVSGLTQGQLQQRIQAAYRSAQIYTSPTIIINVDSGDLTTRVITVAGEVNSPGPIPYRPGITLLDAISAAKGFTDYADTKEVALIRNGKTTEHNLKNISANPGLDVQLRPDDRIVVRQRGFF